MATTLYLRDGVANQLFIAPGPVCDVSTSAGTNLKTGVIATVVATEILWQRQTNQDVLQWITGRSPVGGWTLAGTFTVSAYAAESAGQANCGLRLRLYKRTAAGTVTEIGGSPWDDGVELSTSTTLMTWTGTPTSTAFAEDDRLLIRIYATGAGGSIGTGRQAFLNHNGPAGSGDAKIALNETVTFKAEVTPLTNYLNPADSADGGTLSNGNLTYACTAAGETLPRNTRSVLGVASGEKKYFEVTINSMQTTGYNSCVGLISPLSATRGIWFGTGADDAVVFDRHNAWHSNNTSQATAAPDYSTATQKLGVAVDRVNNKLWMKLIGGLWNTNASDDPATNTGGFSFNPSGVIYPGATVVGMGGGASSFTFNFGATAFAATPPSGFSAIGTYFTGLDTTLGAMTVAATGKAIVRGTNAPFLSVVNPTIVLSNQNLTATDVYNIPGDTYQSGRASVGILSGERKYFSAQATVLANNPNNIAIGLVNGSASLANYLGVDFNSVGLFDGNGIFLNNANVLNIPGFAINTPVDVAVDRIINRAWWRVAGSAGWNNDTLANQNPALGVGGVNISGISGTLYPGFTLLSDATHNASITFDFGITGCPEGFTVLGGNLGTLTLAATGTAQNQVYTGTLSATLGAMTAAGTGAVTTPARTGTLAVTLGTMTAAGTGLVANQVFTGTLAATLGPMTMVGVGNVPVRGTASPTLGVLTLAATGTAVNQVYTGTLSATLDALTLAAAGGVVVSGPLVAIEAQDIANFVGAYGTTLGGALTAIETPDTALFTGNVLVSGPLITTEAKDVATFAGQVVIGAVLAAIEAKDTALFAGSIAWAATLVATEAKDTALFTGGVLVSGPLIATEAKDVALFDGMVLSAIGVTLTATEAQDTAAFAINTVSISGTLAVTEARDIALFTGKLIEKWYLDDVPADGWEREPIPDYSVLRITDTGAVRVINASRVSRVVTYPRTNTLWKKEPPPPPAWAIE